MHTIISRTMYFLIDILLVVICVGVTIGLGGFHHKINLTNTLLIKQVFICVLCYLIIFWFVSAFYIGLNRPNVSLANDIKSILKGVFLSVLFISLFFIFIESWRPNVKWVLLTGLIVLMTVIPNRVFEWKVIRRQHNFLALFIGLEDYWMESLEEFRRKLPVNWTLATAFTSSSKSTSEQIISFSDKEVDQFFEFCIENKFMPILILNEQLINSQELSNFIRKCFSQGVSSVSITDFYETILEKVPLFRQNDKWIVKSEFVLPSYWRLLIKRLFDLLFGIIFFIISIPIILVFGAAIKIESDGPIFFIQERLGKNMQPFKMIKLRTMKIHEDDSLKWPHVADDLITPLGKILRKIGIDEIPQLINIILGHMSFVGPRPSRPLVSHRHAKRIPFFALVYPMPPGISGWAQIHQGRDTSEESVYEKIRYNLYYVKHFSVLLDIRVVVRTIKMLFKIKKPARFKKGMADI